MASMSFPRLLLAGACALASSATLAADGPAAVDALIDQLAPAQRAALLAGADPASVHLPDGRSLAAAGMGLLSYQVVSQASFVGQTVVPSRAGPNDAAWFLNAQDGTWGERTEFGARIVHDGFLTTQGAGLDHIAIGIRGSSVDGLLAQIGPSTTTPWRFAWGEQLNAQVAAGSVGLPQLYASISGRGPTLWPTGSWLCTDQSRPCLVFENFTTNLTGPGLVCTGAPGACGRDVALSLGSGPFDLFIEADDYDMRVVIRQNGVLLANASCRQLAPFDARCGAQPGDVAVADAFIGNVLVNQSGAGWHPRQIGILDAYVRTLAEVWTDPTCPGCVIP